MLRAGFSLTRGELVDHWRDHTIYHVHKRETNTPDFGQWARLRDTLADCLCAWSGTPETTLKVVAWERQAACTIPLSGRQRRKRFARGTATIAFGKQTSKCPQHAATDCGLPAKSPRICVRAEREQASGLSKARTADSPIQLPHKRAGNSGGGQGDCNVHRYEVFQASKGQWGQVPMFQSVITKSFV